MNRWNPNVDWIERLIKIMIGKGEVIVPGQKSDSVERYAIFGLHEKHNIASTMQISSKVMK